MALVHAWGLFEHYLGSLVRRILLGRPVMLGRTKKIDLGDLLDSPSKEALLADVAEDEIRGLIYKTTRDQLRLLRERYGFRHLAEGDDDTIVEMSLLRNCVVHNCGVADKKLEEHSAGRYRDGAPLEIDTGLVIQSIRVFRAFASRIDEIA
ncbi:hypothetical protein AYO40_05945 [Planctomycetaceae bacterium SCGC AG-212-D15]|nr:hypothetical protein AYO40_05945 [Planctomycetaceae bacterium SCGC AG-212-D15]